MNISRYPEPGHLQNGHSLQHAPLREEERERERERERENTPLQACCTLDSRTPGMFISRNFSKVESLAWSKHSQSPATSIFRSRTLTEHSMTEKVANAAQMITGLTFSYRDIFTWIILASPSLRQSKTDAEEKCLLKDLVGFNACHQIRQNFTLTSLQDNQQFQEQPRNLI